MPRLARGLPQKQDSIKIVSRIPSGADGKAGDMRLLAQSSIEGAILYVKAGNKWFPFQSGIDTSLSDQRLLKEDGYQTLDSGLIIQWGTLAHGSITTALTFPKAFPTAVFMCVVSAADASISSAAEQCGTDDLTVTGVNVIGYRNDTGYAIGTVHWIAIGK